MSFTIYYSDQDERKFVPPVNMEPHVHEYTAKEISCVARMLMHGSKLIPALPFELAERIIDTAELWCKSSVTSSHGMSGQNMNQMYLSIEKSKHSEASDVDSTYLAPESYNLEFESFRKCRRIEFEFFAHDQGWSADNGSWTWAEADIVKSGSEEVLVDRVEIYRNPAAQLEPTRHVKIFESDSVLCEKFVAGECELKVWMRSWFPGWCHYIKHGKITIYYSIDIDIAQV